MEASPDVKTDKRFETDPETVVFKGYKSGLTLIIPETGPFEKYFEELKQRLEQSQDFFKGAKVSLNTGNRVLPESELSALVQLVKDSGLFLQHFPEEPKVFKPSRKSQSAKEPDFFVATVTVKKTVRSGQRVEFEGNLVIMGDVNPGAEVVASGDIVVLGTLRGTAHAGAKGDLTAQIIAFQLKPVQIRIAGVFTRAPEKDRQFRYTGPEVAKIRDNRIVVERCNSIGS
jgi:septum site-determining protein MinC